jgi:hypothetical protein
MLIYEDGIPASYDDIGGDAPCVFCGQYMQGKDVEGMCWECWYLLDWGVRAERQRIVELLMAKALEVADGTYDANIVLKNIISELEAAK